MQAFSVSSRVSHTSTLPAACHRPSVCRSTARAPLRPYHQRSVTVAARTSEPLAAADLAEQAAARVPTSTVEQKVLSEDSHELSASSVPSGIQAIADNFQSLSDAKERYKLLLKYAKGLPTMNASDKVSTNRVMGCTAEVWMNASLDTNNRVQFSGDSNSELTRGLCALLVQGMSGLTPEEVLQVKPEMLSVLQLGPAIMAPSRTNGFLNMLETMRKRTVMLTEQLPRFPSLVITGDNVTPQGSFAETQAQYLAPDSAQVDALVKVLSEKKIGIVAHFYMDPQVQGVLSSAAQR